MCKHWSGYPSASLAAAVKATAILAKIRATASKAAGPAPEVVYIGLTNTQDFSSHSCKSLGRRPCRGVKFLWARGRVPKKGERRR
jgi:hypothetical protein